MMVWGGVPESQSFWQVRFLCPLMLWTLFCLGHLWTLFPLFCLAVLTWLPSKSCRGVCFGQRWLWWIALFGMIRFGEATNPGPSVHFEAEQFTLGVFNPSGLRNKAHYFQSHLAYGDLWMVTETHFYGKDVSRFRAGLCAAKSAHKYCLTDCKSVGKSFTSQTSWKGVGILSKHPTRALPSAMPMQVQESGRSLLFTTLFGDVWICGGTVYGEPNSSHYPSYLKNNEMLLHHVASHACLSLVQGTTSGWRRLERDPGLPSGLFHFGQCWFQGYPGCCPGTLGDTSAKHLQDAH